MNAWQAMDTALELHGVLYPHSKAMMAELDRLGFAVVPKEPTFEILSCGADEISGYQEGASRSHEVAREAWIAMLKAARQ